MIETSLCVKFEGKKIFEKTQQIFEGQVIQIENVRLSFLFRVLFLTSLKTKTQKKVWKESEGECLD